MELKFYYSSLNGKRVSLSRKTRELAVEHKYE